MNEKIDTLIVGAGQAGLAMSEHLGNHGVPHLILERHRIAERWRTERWDSLVANGPVWHDRFPGLEFSDLNPDAFAPKERVADYFVEYAEKISAPVRCGVDVVDVRRNPDRPGFFVKTSEGELEATRIVAATGPFQRPIIPAVIAESPELTQIHSSAYRNPQQLPQGAVLVVGAGASGVQIADELQRAGRRVYLSVGSHDRPPRSYRGRDFVWWLGVLGKWDTQAIPGMEHVTISVSGARGGYTVDFRQLAEQGVVLVGMTDIFKDGILHFRPDLEQNLARGDENYLSILDEADAYVTRNGLDLPEEPEARLIPDNPECVTNPVVQLDMKEAGISTILWATGFGVDYSWLKADIFDAKGRPVHQRGVTTEPGIYFLGLPWQSRRGSSFIWGVWHDAKFLADHIATQRGYLDYHDRAQRKASQETQA